MKSISFILIICDILLPPAVCNAQIDNGKTVTVKIQGNCSMCESSIEKAGTRKKSAKIDWDKDTRQAIITYDTGQTSIDEILKRIALAGYDNEKFLAPDDVYSRLPECCQYERQFKTNVVRTSAGAITEHNTNGKAGSADVAGLQPVAEAYFSLKDALIKSDIRIVAGEAKVLSDIIGAVKTDQFSTEERAAWLQVKEAFVSEAGHIRDAKNIEEQRSHFKSLSSNMHTLLKAVPLNIPVYYQFCPMADSGKGANWLSKDREIRNPYYGSRMLTCGKVEETINNE